MRYVRFYNWLQMPYNEISVCQWKLFSTHNTAAVSFYKLKLIGLSWNISLHAIQLGLHLTGKNLSAELMASLPGSSRPDQQHQTIQPLKRAFLSLSITGNTRALGEHWGCRFLVWVWKPLLVSISWSQGRRVFRKKRSMLSSWGSYDACSREIWFSVWSGAW